MSSRSRREFLADVGKGMFLTTLGAGLAADLGLAAAEATFAAQAGSPTDALNNLMCMVDDGAEVHRVVLVSRSWDLLDFVGRDKAHTLLRQSVHYCVKAEPGSARYDAAVRELLP